MIISSRKFKRFKARNSKLSIVKRKSPINIQKASFFKKIFKVVNVILLSIIIYFGYFFFGSSYFNIDDIQVSELAHTSTGQFLELVDNHLNSYKFLGIKTTNYFLYNNESLQDEINKSYYFESLKIEKNLPNHISIKMQEKNVIYRIYSYENEYLLDDVGQIVKKITNLSNRPQILTVSEIQKETDDIINDVYQDKISFINTDEFVSLFTDESTEFDIGEFILDNQQLKFINQIIASYGTNIFVIKRIILPSKFPQYIEVLTDEGWTVIFNINDDYTEQIKKLKIILTEQIGEKSRPRIDYIDLRLGNNIYYKYKY